MTLLFRWMRLGLCACLGAVWVAQAQEVAPDPRPQIRAEREALNQKKQALEAAYQQQLAACWQRFAVNDCLDRVKKQHARELRPLHEAEFALNDRQRLWEAQARDRRLERKQSEAR